MSATALTDSFGRRIEYVRVSITDRCDLRCSYCMPKGFRDFEEPGDWLTFDELERVMAAFARLGTRRIRLTGGEPLVRRDLPVLARRLSVLPGVEDISLSTNATRLARSAIELRAAGIRRINVSLDSLRPEVFKQITGGKLEKVLAGLMAAKAAGFHPIKINMVVMAGVNEDEVEDMVRFCLEHGFTLRFIETMPMGDTGRDAIGRYRRSAEGEGPAGGGFRTGTGRDARRRPRALREGRRQRPAHRFHHPDLAAFLRHLQPGTTVGRRDHLHLPGQRAPAGTASAPARRLLGRGDRGRDPRGHPAETGTARVQRKARKDRPLHVHDRRLKR
jgi:molybdenum cofactor biosynthesis enzyme MoaA